MLPMFNVRPVAFAGNLASDVKIVAIPDGQSKLNCVKVFNY